MGSDRAFRGGRDIDNPHRRNVGKILAQDKRCGSCSKTQEARTAEQALKAVIQLEEAKDFTVLLTIKKDYGKLENEMNQRNALEPQLEACNLKLEQLKSVMQQWPQKTERLRYLSENKPETEKRIEKLKQELEQAEKEQELKRKRQIYKNARQLNEQLHEVKAELNKLPLSQMRFRNNWQKKKQLAGLKAEISGMKLQIRFDTKMR